MYHLLVTKLCACYGTLVKTILFSIGIMEAQKKLGGTIQTDVRHNHSISIASGDRSLSGKIRVSPAGLKSNLEVNDAQPIASWIAPGSFLGNKLWRFLDGFGVHGKAL